MLGLSGVQQQEPYHYPQNPKQHQRQPSPQKKGRLCLYCQQRGCQGIQNCWWPRVRSAAARYHHKPASELTYNQTDIDVKSKQGPAGALEENLRTQIRVLEREVQLLRAGLHNLASPYRRGKKDAATMTSAELNVPDLFLHGHKEERNASGLPLPSHVIAPSFLSGTSPQQEQQQKFVVPEAVNVHKFNPKYYTSDAVDEPFLGHIPTSPSPLESIERKHAEGLEQLVLELTSQNTILCRKLAEMKVVLEQRDALLQPMVEKQSLPQNAVTLSSLTQASTNSSPSEPSQSLLSKILRLQEEMARLSGEFQHARNEGKSSEENLKDSDVVLGNLQRQFQKLTVSLEANLKQKNTEKENKAAASSAINTNNSSSSTARNDAERAVGIDLKVPAVVSAPAVVPPSPSEEKLISEVRDLRERLALAERKVIAWETWYGQQARQSTSSPLSQSPMEKDVLSMSRKSSQEAAKVVLRAFPASAPKYHVDLNNVLSPHREEVSDALTIDTYALMAREAVLRQVAEQERANLMAALMMEGDAEQQV